MHVFHAYRNQIKDKMLHLKLKKAVPFQWNTFFIKTKIYALTYQKRI